MDEVLLELRRARTRREALEHRREEVKATIAMIIGFLILTAFFVIVWLTDDAYAMPIYDATTSEMSEQEYDELTKIVCLESHTEDIIGQMAVVEVIFNRREHEQFPDTIHGVLSQKGQFSTWHKRNSAFISQMQIDAIEEVITEEQSVLKPYVNYAKHIGTIDKRTECKDYIFFCTPRAYRKVGYKYMHNIIQIGGHIFGTGG